MGVLAWMLVRFPHRHLVGWCFGIGANVVAFRFVPDVIARFTPLPWIVGVVALILLAAAQGLRWWAAAAVHGALVKRGVAPWLAFGVGVYAGTFVPMVFPWNPGGGASPWPATVQLAELVGERGVTFLMAVAAALAAHAVATRSWKHGAIAIALPVACTAEGALRIRSVEAWRAGAPTVKVALVEPSIEATERWDPTRAAAILTKLEGLTRSAEKQGVELTVWPEAAYPYEIGHHSRRAPVGTFAVLGEGVHGPVLTGTIMHEANEGAFNSAVVVSRDGTLSAPYDKMHLLWFGEAVPLGEELPWLRKMFSRSGGLRPGHEQVALESGRIRAAVLNCFEDTLPAAGREAMTVAPNLLVNVTNDAWFVGSQESELHLRMAALRSVELRRDMVRAVNGGPTGWIDAAGRVRARWTTPDLAGVVVAEPALLDASPTPFARFGDVPWALAVLAWPAIVVATKRRRRQPDKAD